MEKIFFVILVATILQFTFTKGQIDPNSRSTEYDNPAYFTPNASSGLWKNPDTTSRNSPPQENFGNDPRRRDMYPTYSGSDGNDPHRVQRYPTYSGLNGNDPRRVQRYPTYSGSDQNDPQRVQRYPTYSGSDGDDIQRRERYPTYSGLHGNDPRRVQRNPSYPGSDGDDIQRRDRYPTYSGLDRNDPRRHERYPTYSGSDASRRMYNRRRQRKFPNGASSEKDSQRAESQLQPPTYYQTDPLKVGRIVCSFRTSKFLQTGFNASMIPASLCTIINYEFATLNPKTYELNPGNPSLDYDENFYNITVGLKRINPYLKVMLSLGGWTDSTKKYSDLVASPKKVSNFITKVIRFLKDHRFDGLDVAWEYPNCWQGALGVNKDDKPNFAKFLKEIRKKFAPENLLLSISVSPILREIKVGYDGPTISETVDFVNVMTYDMHGPWENKTGHHSQFDKRDNDSDPFLNSKSAMEYWTSIGVPPKKLNMGIPAYGTTYTLVNSTKHGLGAPSKGPGRRGALSKNGGTLSYREICQYLDAGNWTEEIDMQAGSYAYSGDQWTGYNSPRDVVRKTEWIADNGYGGIIVKDFAGDDFEGICKMTKFPLIRIAGMQFTKTLNEKQ